MKPCPHAERREDVLAQIASSVWPLTASTVLPTKSMLMPYSQPVARIECDGVFRAAFLQVMMPGIGMLG